MSKINFENKSLVFIVAAGYFFNLLFSLSGFLSVDNSREQILFYQVGNAFAITASVMAGRYIGLRGQHVAASAYILLGIAHGISLAALGRLSINVDRGITMAMPMIPALIFMFWCDLYPRWLRIAAIIPAALFTLVYINVQSGYSYFDWPLTFGYGILQIIEVLWGIYLVKDWKENRQQ